MAKKRRRRPAPTSPTYTVHIIELSRDAEAEQAVAEALERRGHRVFWG